MSFTITIKDELCRTRVKRQDCCLSELAGLVHTAGTLRLARTPELICQSESHAVAKRVAQLSSELYSLDVTLGRKEQQHRKLPLALVTLSGADCQRLLLDTAVLSRENGAISFNFDKRLPDALTDSEDKLRAFLRGAFLGAGSCSDPARGYHLEIAARTEGFARALSERISSFCLSAKSAHRKGRWLVYLKGDDVSGFLALIGASSAALRFEDVRAEKDYRNYINRTSNCETANIDKTVTAALLQLQAIERIEQHQELSDLPAPLYEAARLRLQYPDATLQELADYAEIGKSGMNHRLARLLALAKEYED